MIGWLQRRCVGWEKSVRRPILFAHPKHTETCAESNHSHSAVETRSHYPPLDLEQPPRAAHQDDEPLLSLLASSHPWLGGTINGSLSAYTSTKSYTPRFIQYGADLIERNIGSPVASTVGTVGRRTGVEGSLRRYLGSRRTSEIDRIDPEILQQDVAHKRLRLGAEQDQDMDVEQEISESVQRTVSGHSSIETLPAYDENRSPAYEESNAIVEASRPHHRLFRPSANRSWSTQLMISTSGLGAALNEASLRSLKYCLNILRGANDHVRNLMDALKRLISEYERNPHPGRLQNGQVKPADSGSEHIEYAENSFEVNREQAMQAEHAETITQRIRHLNDEIWNTLKNVVTNVSTYTGGALPDNESGFVKRQLMSVPGRWQRAISRSSASSSESQQQGANEHDAVSSAHRMLAFALEGLDMMEQVGGVVDSTIVSAEGWLESMGKGHNRGSSSWCAALGGCSRSSGG